MTLNEHLIEKLWDRFEHSSVSEMKFELDGACLELKKGTPDRALAAVSPAPASYAPTAYAPMAYSPAAYAPASPAQASPAAFSPASTLANAGPAQEASGPDSSSYITSPVPGTFYRAASPEEEPYVSVGREIHRGDVVCIVESMKMMNEIRAEADGIVAEVLADNGEVVGYGEKLIRLEPLSASEMSHV